MNAIQVSLASLVMFGGLFVTRPVLADHLRDSERAADRLHERTIEYVRHLRYEVPPSQFSPQLRQDAMAVLWAVNHLQQLLLFTGGAPGEVRQLREQLYEVDLLVDEIHHRVEAYAEAVEHADEQGGFEHLGPVHQDGLRFAPGQAQLRFGRGFVIDIPHHDRRHRERVDLDRLEDRLRDLARRLEKVHRTLHDVDDALRRAGR